MRSHERWVMPYVMLGAVVAAAIWVAGRFSCSRAASILGEAGLGWGLLYLVAWACGMATPHVLAVVLTQRDVKRDLQCGGSWQAAFVVGVAVTALSALGGVAAAFLRSSVLVAVATAAVSILAPTVALTILLIRQRGSPEFHRLLAIAPAWAVLSVPVVLNPFAQGLEAVTYCRVHEGSAISLLYLGWTPAAIISVALLARATRYLVARGVAAA